MFAPSRPGAWLVALAALWSAVGIAPAQPPAGAPPAVLKGRVTDKKGVPLPGVRVRVAVPATDMRFMNFQTGRAIAQVLMNVPDEFSLLEAQSDAGGNYRLELPGVAEPTKIAIDAMTPGYRRLVGTLMQGGDAPQLQAEPGRELEANLALEPARYYAGTVVDEQGKPVAGVEVSSNVRIDRGSGGIERTATGPDGAFELFNFPTEPFQGQTGPGRGVVYYSHPDYIGQTDDQIDQVARADRDHLRVVLPMGRKVAGTVRDASGKPVAGALVKVGLATGARQKGTRTDANGRFALRGLSPGISTLDVRALAIKQKLKMPLLLDADKTDLEFTLQPIVFPKDVPSHVVLGMRLADVTPELQAAYDLYHPKGAVILDPGPDADRLDIGPIAEGNEFWMAGDNRVSGLRDFVDRIIAETGGRDAESHSVRVVYSFITPEAQGNNTQYLKLTRADLAQLKELAAQLRAEAK